MAELSNKALSPGEDVLRFWFDEIPEQAWWRKSLTFDRDVTVRFEALLDQAKRGELFSWRERAEGRLAEIIILDQFSRNIYRNDARAFSQDGMALVLAQEAIACQCDQLLPLRQRAFIYMPFMHSESLAIHRRGLALFEQLGDANNLAFERQHKDIIQRFGRYPHRNAILGRPSSAEEVQFLTEPHSSF